MKIFWIINPPVHPYHQLNCRSLPEFPVYLRDIGYQLYSVTYHQSLSLRYVQLSKCSDEVIRFQQLQVVLYQTKNIITLSSTEEKTHTYATGTAMPSHTKSYKRRVSYR